MWQDIETAPKDTPFLGARVEEGYQTYYWLIRGLQLRYDGEDEILGKGYRWNSLTGGGYNIRLTHWQPLPEPPAPETVTPSPSDAPKQVPS